MVFFIKNVLKFIDIILILKNIFVIEIMKIIMNVIVCVCVCKYKN